MTQNEKLMEMLPIDRFSPKDMPEGSKSWYKLHLLESMMGAVTVPVAVTRGNGKGPLIVVTAGVHGDEFEGMESIRRLFDELHSDSLRGTFVGIPVVNPFAYEGQMRETPALWDGLNLARQFPGLAQGTLTQQLAFVWHEWMVRTMDENDVFIDFHSAGTRFEYVSMVGFHSTDDRNEARSYELAAAFGMERIWRIPDKPDTRITFNGSVSRRGVPTIATEVRGRGGIVESDVGELVSGIWNILRYKGMVENESEYRSKSELGSLPTWGTEWLWIRTAGLFRPFVDLGDHIEKNQPLGQIISIIGKTLEEIVAPIDGTVWGIRRFSTVQTGDYIYLIGYEEDTP